MFDEIEISQAALPGPLATGSLTVGFESDEPADGVAAGLGVEDLGGGALTGNLAHTSGARTGARCARLDVASAYEPAWHAKLRLGSFRVVDSMLNVTLHARLERAPASATAPPPFVTVDVLDGSAGAVQWLGHWQRFNLTAAAWRRFEALVPLPPAKRGHVLEVSVVVGHAAATYLLDDVSVSQRDSLASALSIALNFEGWAAASPPTHR